MEIVDSVTLSSSLTAATSVMTNASASSPGGPNCPVELGVQMTRTKDIINTTAPPAPSSCFSATSGSTAVDFSSSSTVEPMLVTSNCTPANLKCNETAFRSSAATTCATGDLITAISILTDTNNTVPSAPSKLMGEISYFRDTANAAKSSTNEVYVQAEPKVLSMYKSGSNISNATKSSPNHLDVQKGAEPKVLSTHNLVSASVSTAESADVCEESFKTTTSYKGLSAAPSTTTAVSQTEVVSSAPTSKYQPQNGFMGKMVYTKHSVSPNIITSHIGKSNPSAAPTKPVFVRSQHKPLPIEPPSIQDRQAESYQGPCSIGVDEIIKVSCEDKRQSYCQLCKVRLVTSKHTKSFKHQYEYVKLKNPRWTPDPSKLAEELRQKVAELSKIQKGANLPLKSIRVNLDVYQELAQLPEATALQRLLEMRTSRNSPSTADPGKHTRQPVVSASPLTDSPQSDIAGLSPHNQTEMGNKCELKMVLAQKTELTVGSPQTTSVMEVRPPSKIPDTGGKTIVHGKCQKSCPVLQDTQDSTVGLKKTLLSKSISSDARVRQSTLSQKAEPSRCSPGQAEVFKAQDTIRLGEMVPGPSNLSRSLRVMVTEPFIGLGAIWECRGISNKPLSTIYLCECCNLKLMNSDISPHMTSINHQITYLLKKRRYKKFMYWWSDKDLKPAHKEELVRDLVGFLGERETSMDAQSVLLHLQAYDYVCKGPFSNALNLVQRIQCNDKLNMPIARVITPPSSSPSASMESQMPLVHPETTHQRKGPDRTASLSQMHIQQQPRQVTTLPIVQTNTTPGASSWVIPAVPPQQVLVSNVVYPIVASNTIYVTPPTPQFIQNGRPAQVQNQCTVIAGNSNTQPPVPAVERSTHPGFFHSQR